MTSVASLAVFDGFKLGGPGPDHLGLDGWLIEFSGFQSPSDRAVCFGIFLIFEPTDYGKPRASVTLEFTQLELAACEPSSISQKFFSAAEAAVDFVRGQIAAEL